MFKPSTFCKSIKATCHIPVKPALLFLPIGDQSPEEDTDSTHGTVIYDRCIQINSGIARDIVLSQYNEIIRRWIPYARGDTLLMESVCESMRLICSWLIQRLADLHVNSLRDFLSLCTNLGKVFGYRTFTCFCKD